MNNLEGPEGQKIALEKINKLYDFDSPDAIEFDLLVDCMNAFKNNKSFLMPKYNKKTKTREENWVTVEPCGIVIVEGHLVFAHQELTDMFNMKIYIDADDDVRLTRRILKEKAEAEKDEDFDIMKCLERYEKFVKPAYDKYVEPTKKFADMVIPNNIQTGLQLDSLSEDEKKTLSINRSMLII